MWLAGDLADGVGPLLPSSGLGLSGSAVSVDELQGSADSVLFRGRPKVYISVVPPQSPGNVPRMRAGGGEGFATRLHRTRDRHGPLCVGIDPHPALLADWGLPGDAAGVERFALSAVDALAGEIGVLKPQSAFFEAHGSRGIAVLERVLAAARDAGLLVVLDVKRADIGSTVSAYTAAYLDGDSPLAADAITVSPYLGFGALEPALQAAEQSGRGVFVLARTSNPEGAEIQLAHTTPDVSVAQSVVDAVSQRNRAGVGGAIGVVVGATAAHGLDLTGLGGPILAPGLGAQGAVPNDLPRIFGPAIRDVVPVASRAVLRHGPDPASLRLAAARLRDELAALG